MSQTSTIIKKSEGTALKDELAVIMGIGVKSITNAVREVLNIDGWFMLNSIQYETGESKEVLVIKSGEDFFSTISATFMTDFMAALEYLDANEMTMKSFRVKRETSKKGREFLRCEPEEIVKKG